MSVIVMARLSSNSHDIEGASRRASELWRSIEPAARNSGCIDHKVIATGDEALLVEEWNDTREFEVFFDRMQSYRRAIDEVGFRGFPDDIKLWRRLPGTRRPG